MRTAREILDAWGVRGGDTNRMHSYTLCPKCSDTRHGFNRKKKCLHVTVDDVGVMVFCNNCPWNDGAYFDVRQAAESQGRRMVRAQGNRPGVGRSYADLHRTARGAWRGDPRR